MHEWINGDITFLSGVIKLKGDWLICVKVALFYDSAFAVAINLSQRLADNLTEFFFVLMAIGYSLVLMLTTSLSS